jgi:hypothetical protein
MEKIFPSKKKMGRSSAKKWEINIENKKRRKNKIR